MEGVFFAEYKGKILTFIMTLSDLELKSNLTINNPQLIILKLERFFLNFNVAHIKISLYYIKIR